MLVFCGLRRRWSSNPTERQCLRDLLSLVSCGTCTCGWPDEVALSLAGVVQLLNKEQDRLSKELHGIGAALAAFGESYGKQTGTRPRLSAAARARIAAAQTARWAKVKASKSQSRNGTAAAEANDVRSGPQANRCCSAREMGQGKGCKKG